MSNVMQFPSTPKEFIEQHTQEGLCGELVIPVFRVEQMLRYYYKGVNKITLCKDCPKFKAEGFGVGTCRITELKCSENGWCKLGNVDDVSKPASTEPTMKLVRENDEIRALGAITFVMKRTGLGEEEYETIIYGQDYYTNRFRDALGSQITLNVTVQAATKQYYEEHFTYAEHVLMPGKAFLEDVLNGNLRSEYGYVDQIFVDGYVSNLSLCTGVADRPLSDGGCLVNAETFRSICNKFEVYVNWVDR